VKSIVRATAILASGSVVSVAVGLVSAKVWALLVGPAGVGMLGLMLSVIGLGGIVAGMGLGTALVRAGAHALGRDDPAAAAAVQRAASRATLLLAGFTALLFFVLRDPLARWFLGGSEHTGSVVWLGLAIGFTLIAGVQLSTLNAHHRVSALARAMVLSSVCGAAVGLTILWLLRERGIVFAAMAPALSSAVVASWLVRRELPRYPVPIHGPEVRAALRSLLRFGIPFTASSLVGSGVLLLLPVLVLHLLTAEHVGYYRAAFTLTVGYLGILLTAMGQDYYPRVSSAQHDPEKLRGLINDQLRLITMIGAPLILLGLALAPYLIAVVFAPSFAPATPVLEWHLLGSLFKFWSWALAFVILARCGSGTYFFTEAVGGGVLLLASWLGVLLFGLPGIGVGFLATYVVYAALVWVVMRREIRIVITAPNRWLMFTAVAGSVGVFLLSRSSLAAATIPVAALLALALFLTSGSELWRDWLRRRSAPRVEPEAGTGIEDLPLAEAPGTPRQR
jgi:O-antigen/teichoic acid export membrane protein